MFLFLHIFKCLCDSASPTRGGILLYFKLVIHGFEPLMELSSIEDQFFLVTSVIQKSHSTICDVGNRVDGRCVNLFRKYWAEVTFYGK